MMMQQPTDRKRAAANGSWDPEAELNNMPEIKETDTMVHHSSTAHHHQMRSGLRREHWYGLDWCRFLCIFYVVFGHTYKVSLYESGEMMRGNKEMEKMYDTMHIFRAVSIGYHWCVPLLFFISGVSMAIFVNSYLRRQRENEITSFEHGNSSSHRQKGMVGNHLRVLGTSLWRLSHIFIIGFIINIVQVNLAPTEWGGGYAPVIQKGETLWAYRSRWWSWLFNMDPVQGGFVKAGLFGIIGSQWYTIVLMVFVAMSMPWLLWIKDVNEDAKKWRAVGVLALLAVLTKVGLLATSLQYEDVVIIISGTFVPAILLACFMISKKWLKLGLFVFFVLSLMLCIRKPAPKEIFYIQFYIFFLSGYFVTEFKAKLFDEHNTLYLFKDWASVFPWLIYIFWNVLPVIFEGLFTSIRGPYPIHKDMNRRLGTMAGTWFIVLISFCGSLTYMNRPVIPCIYSKLKNLGNILFLAHTLLITLFWQHVAMPLGMGLQLRFFVSCHVIVLGVLLLLHIPTAYSYLAQRYYPPAKTQ